MWPGNNTSFLRPGSSLDGSFPFGMGSKPISAYDSTTGGFCSIDLTVCVCFVCSCCSFQLRQHNPRRGAAIDANGLRQLHPQRLPGERIRDGSRRGVHSDCGHLLLRLRIALALRPRHEGVHHRHWGACNCSTWGHIPHHQTARTKPQPLSPRILALHRITSLIRLRHRCCCRTHPAMLIQSRDGRCFSFYFVHLNY